MAGDLAVLLHLTRNWSSSGEDTAASDFESSISSEQLQCLAEVLDTLLQCTTSTCTGNGTLPVLRELLPRLTTDLPAALACGLHFVHPSCGIPSTDANSSTGIASVPCGSMSQAASTCTVCASPNDAPRTLVLASPPSTEVHLTPERVPSPTRWSGLRSASSAHIPQRAALPAIQPMHGSVNGTAESAVCTSPSLCETTAAAGTGTSSQDGTSEAAASVVGATGIDLISQSQSLAPSALAGIAEKSTRLANAWLQQLGLSGGLAAILGSGRVPEGSAADMHSSTAPPGLAEQAGVVMQLVEVLLDHILLGAPRTGGLSTVNIETSAGQPPLPSVLLQLLGVHVEARSVYSQQTSGTAAVMTHSYPTEMTIESDKPPCGSQSTLIIFMNSWPLQEQEWRRAAS